MKIEVVEFYPQKKKKGISVGTLHIYIVDLDMDLRGIRVCRRGDRWHFDFPSLPGVDEETGKNVFYPIINFIDSDKNRALMKQISIEGTKYVKDFLKKKSTQHRLSAPVTSKIGVYSVKRP